MMSLTLRLGSFKTLPAYISCTTSRLSAADSCSRVPRTAIHPAAKLPHRLRAWTGLPFVLFCYLTLYVSNRCFQWHRQGIGVIVLRGILDQERDLLVTTAFGAALIRHIIRIYRARTRTAVGLHNIESRVMCPCPHNTPYVADVNYMQTVLSLSGLLN